MFTNMTNIMMNQNMTPYTYQMQTMPTMMSSPMKNYYTTMENSPQTTMPYQMWNYSTFPYNWNTCMMPMTNQMQFTQMTNMQNYPMNHQMLNTCTMPTNMMNYNTF